MPCNSQIPTEGEVMDAILDLIAIIPFGIYPTNGEAAKANAAVATIYSYLKMEKINVRI